MVDRVYSILLDIKFFVSNYQSGHNLNIKNTRFFCTCLEFDRESARVKQFFDLSAHIMVFFSILY